MKFFNNCELIIYLICEACFPTISYPIRYEKALVHYFNASNGHFSYIKKYDPVAKILCKNVDFICTKCSEILITKEERIEIDSIYRLSQISSWDDLLRMGETICEYLEHKGHKKL